MSDDRPLREELEQLGGALKDARERVEAAELTAQVRAQAEAIRLLTLRAQRDALTAQLEAMTLARDSQGEELRELEASLGRARDSIPAASRPEYTGAGPEAPDLLRFFSEPTPHYARQHSWLGKLFARWLAATGREWK